MGPRIRGSDVYVVEDIERILSALAGAARRYGGDYGAGYGDAMTPQEVLYAIGMITGGLAVLGLGLGLVAVAIHERGQR